MTNMRYANSKPTQCSCPNSSISFFPPKSLSAPATSSWDGCDETFNWEEDLESHVWIMITPASSAKSKACSYSIISFFPSKSFQSSPVTEFFITTTTPLKVGQSVVAGIRVLQLFGYFASQQCMQQELLDFGMQFAHNPNFAAFLTFWIMYCNWPIWNLLTILILLPF